MSGVKTSVNYTALKSGFCFRDKEDKVENEAAFATFSDKEKEIRLALSHNLAQAIIHEGTVES